MVEVLIRVASPTDIGALRDIFRRSSLSNDGDRDALLAHPEALELPALAVNEGRTRVAVAPHALHFYERVGFLGDGTVETEFGPGERMHLDC